MLLDTSKIAPEPVTIQVGSVQLPLHPANIIAAEKFFAVLDNIDLENLVQPIASGLVGVMQAQQEAAVLALPRLEAVEASQAKLARVDEIDAILNEVSYASDEPLPKERDQLLEEVQAHTDAVASMGRVKGFVEFLADFVTESGSDIIAKVKPVLGRQFIPAIRDAVIAVLDTQATYNALTATGGPLEQAGPGKSVADVDSDGCFVGCKAVRAFIKTNLRIDQGVEILATAIRVNDLVGALGKFVGGLTPPAAETETQATA